MIYVLVKDALDYDEDDIIVFASTSKEVVEKKHSEILEHKSFIILRRVMGVMRKFL